MNLQIRFTDDTTEERDAASPCIFDIFDPVLKHPSEERWYLWFPDADPPLSFCGRNVLTLDDLRGGKAKVWRTGQDVTTKALIGEWQSAYVETREEQIERLTTERDSALFVRDAWKVTASILAGQHEAVSARAANAERERDAALGQVNALHKVVTSSDVDRAVEYAATKIRAANAERERDAARRMVVLRSGGIKSSKEARELDALTNQAVEEGWLKVP